MVKAMRISCALALAAVATAVSADDYYEPNDYLAQAYDLSWDERRWLSDHAGPGEQWDDDWYRVYADYGYERLVVDLRFQDYWGDIDLEVYDSGGWLIGASRSTRDDEYLEVLLPYSGEYFVRVYWGDDGNTYDLWWDDVSVYGDDAYEPNDSIYEAFDLSSWEGYPLSRIAGRGRQSDEDWYAIYVPGDTDTLEVELRFDDSAGDIDLELFDPWGGRVSYSHSSSDGEWLSLSHPAPGYYSVRVYYASRGNTYDLSWRAYRGYGASYGSSGHGGGGTGLGLTLILAVTLPLICLLRGLLRRPERPIARATPA
jgi:hypothetical protein